MDTEDQLLLDFFKNRWPEVRLMDMPRHTYLPGKAGKPDIQATLNTYLQYHRFGRLALKFYTTEGNRICPESPRQWAAIKLLG